MSELGPDYLSVMREALSRFCDEIRSFHADYGQIRLQVLRLSMSKLYLHTLNCWPPRGASPRSSLS